MAEELEKPERARGANAGIALVDHDRAIGRDAARRKQMLDHPEKGLERRRIGVGEADAEQIEVHSMPGVALREQFGRPQIESVGRLASSSSCPASSCGRNQQLRICVPLRIFHHHVSIPNFQFPSLNRAVGLSGSWELEVGP